MKKKKNISGWVGLWAGIVLMTLSYIIWNFSTNEYLLSIQSEIAGAGIAISVLSSLFLIFKLKIQG